jgi:lipid-A-disaccharide synthase-like uncharacterized protein
MGELLAVYLCWTLASGAGAATLPVDADGFMPFQNNYYLWKTIGFGGLVLFQSRWIVQWIHSERHKESRVPLSFWWLSLVGSMLCLLYFLRQQDSVGVMGYLFSVVPYTRNLMLVYRKQRLDREAAAAVVPNDSMVK